MRGKVALLALAAVTVISIAYADGIPSRPRFLSVGVGVAAPAGNGNVTITGVSTATTHRVVSGARQGFLQADGTGASIGTSTDHPVSFYSNNAIGARLQRPADGGRFDAVNGFAVNGVPLTVPAATSGTFAVDLTTGCTTTPSISFRWSVVGSVASVAMTGGSITCTSNSTITALAVGSLPAAIRPAVDLCVAFPMGVDNGAGTNTAVKFDSDGSVNWGEGLGATCTALGWTSSGTKTLNTFTASYPLN